MTFLSLLYMYIEKTLMLYIFAVEEGQLGYAKVIFCYVVSFLLCIWRGGGKPL